MKDLIILLMFVFCSAESTGLMDVDMDKNLQSRFYLKDKTVYVELTNNSKETLQLKSLAFHKDGAGFAVRFRNKEERILKISEGSLSEGSLNIDGFITASVLTSQLYLDHEIPRVSLSPQKNIKIESPISAITWHLSKDSIDFISQNGIEWQFSLFVSSSNTDYDFESQWLPVNLKYLTEK